MTCPTVSKSQCKCICPFTLAVDPKPCVAKDCMWYIYSPDQPNLPGDCVVPTSFINRYISAAF